MAADDCINAVKAAGKGKLSDDDIEDIFREVGKAQQALIAAGKVDNLNARVLERMAKKAEQAKIDAAIARRNAAMNLVVRQNIDSHLRVLTAGGLRIDDAIRVRIEGTSNTSQGIKAGRVSAYAARQGYEGRFVSDMYAAMLRDVPDIAARIKDKAFGDDVVREMYELRENGSPGVTRNEAAQKAAKVFATYAEMSRKDVNAVGGVIGKLDGWAGPQAHDAPKMLKARREVWVQKIKPRLDIEKSFGEVDPDELDKILGGIWDNLVMGARDTEGRPRTLGRVTPGNLGKKAGRSRVLHFKDADNWLAYRDEFGRGNIMTAMAEHQSRMAGYAAQMQMFGPNPEIMLEGVIKAEREKVVTDLTIPEKKRQKLSKQLRFDRGDLRHAFDLMAGHTDSAADQDIAKWGQWARTSQTLSKLGGVVLSGLSEPFAGASMVKFRGGSWLGAMGNQIAGLFETRSGDVAMHRLLIGEGADSLVASIGRMAYAEDGSPGAQSRITDAFFKWTGLTWWTDRMRGVAGDMIAREFGEYSGKGFDALNPRFRHVLGLHGIDAQRWDMIRQAAQDVEGRGKYVYGSSIAALPDDVVRPLAAARLAEIDASKAKWAKDPVEKAKRVAKAIEAARRDLEIQYRGFVADETNFVVVETDARARRTSTWGTQSGTASGEAVRALMQFKGWPIAFTQRVLGRAFFGGPGDTKAARLMNGLPHIAGLLAGMFVGGAISMMAKDTGRGWGARDWTKWETWGAAFLQSGGAGIYGDFLFGEASRYGNSPLATFGGPVIGNAESIWNLFYKAKSGDVRAANAFNVALNNTPFINVFYVRPAIDYLILNSLRESMSPGYLKRQETRRREEFGQKRMIPTQAFPELAR